jgi:hypothetical protein
MVLVCFYVFRFIYRQKSDQPVLNLKYRSEVYRIVESEHFIPHLILFRPNLCIVKSYHKRPFPAYYIRKSNKKYPGDTGHSDLNSGHRKFAVQGAC